MFSHEMQFFLWTRIFNLLRFMNKETFAIMYKMIFNALGFKFVKFAIPKCLINEKHKAGRSCRFNDLNRASALSFSICEKLQRLTGSRNSTSIFYFSNFIALTRNIKTRIYCMGLCAGKVGGVKNEHRVCTGRYRLYRECKNVNQPRGTFFIDVPIMMGFYSPKVFTGFHNVISPSPSFRNGNRDWGE